MAKISFEAGDIIDFFAEDNHKFVGVCLDEKTCIAFLCRLKGGGLVASAEEGCVGSIQAIPVDALVCRFHEGVPNVWKMPFAALIKVVQRNI